MGKEREEAPKEQSFDALRGGNYQQPMAVDHTATHLSADAQARQLAMQPGGKPPVHHVPHLSLLEKAALIGAELVTLLWRLHLDLWHGEVWGNVDVGELMLVLELVAPKSAIKALVLDARTIKANKCFVRINYSKSTAMVASDNLHLAGVDTPGFTAGAADITNFLAYLDMDQHTGHVQFAKASFANATLIRGAERAGVERLSVTGMSFDGVDAAALQAASLRFGSAQLEHFTYPGAPPVSISLAGGSSFDLLWAHTPAPTGPTTTSTTPSGPSSTLPKAPSLGLPPGAEIRISFYGLHGDGAGGDAGAAGHAGFQYAKLSVISAGKELAVVLIQGFVAAASGAAGGRAGGGASIQRLTISGDPKLVKGILTSPVVEPHLQPALDMVHRLGLEPAVGGALVLENLHAAGATSGAQGQGAISGDFLAHIQAPSIGTLDVVLKNFSALGDQDAHGSMAGVASFDGLVVTLRGQTGAELAHLTLIGAGAAKIGKTSGLKVKALQARGDVAALLQQLKGPLAAVPPAARGAIAAIQALGLKGEIDGADLLVSTDGATSYGGTFTANIDAAALGHLKLDLHDLRGTGDKVASFGKVSASLTRPTGALAAAVTMTGGKAHQATAKQHAGLHADSIDVVGNSDAIGSLLGALTKHVPSLPVQVRGAFNGLAALHADGFAAVSMKDVSVSQDGKQDSVARVGALRIDLDLPAVGKAAIKLEGVHSRSAADGEGGAFDALEVELAPKGKSLQRLVRVEGSADELHANGDVSFSTKKVWINADAARVSAMLAAVRAKFSALPLSVVRVFEGIEQYCTAFAGVSATTVENASVTVADKQVTAHGDVSETVKLPLGTVRYAIKGVNITPDHYAFNSLDLTITDASGGTAATLHIDGTSIAADKHGVTDASAGNVSFHGDVTKLRSLLTPEVQALLPPSLLQVFASLDRSQLDLEIAGASVSHDPDSKALTIGVKAIHLCADVHLLDKHGAHYDILGASITVLGNKTVLGPDGNPVEISAEGLEVRGRLVTSGGIELDGAAAVTTGPARVLLAGGKIASVEVSTIKAGLDVTLQDPVKSATTGPETGTGSSSTTPTTASSGTVSPSSTPTLQEGLEAAAQMLDTVDIHTHTPITPGRYGKGFIHLEVADGATISINLLVRKHALDAKGTSVQIVPAIEGPLGTRAKGVHLAQRGTGAVLRFDLGGLLGKLASGLANLFNATGMLVGGKRLPLDLHDLIEQVMGAMQHEVEAAAAADHDVAPTQPVVTAAPTETGTEASRTGVGTGPTTATTTSAPVASTDAWVASEHPTWERHHYNHQQDSNTRRRARRLAEDAKTEPRSSNVLDLFTKGIQLAATTGTADVGLAGNSAFGSGDAHLRGDVRGGGAVDLSLTARELSGEVAGQRVEIKGLDSGAVTATRVGNTTHLAFPALTIDRARWEPK